MVLRTNLFFSLARHAPAFLFINLDMLWLLKQMVEIQIVFLKTSELYSLTMSGSFPFPLCLIRTTQRHSRSSGPYGHNTLIPFHSVLHVPRAEYQWHFICCEVFKSIKWAKGTNIDTLGKLTKAEITTLTCDTNQKCVCLSKKHSASRKNSQRFHFVHILCYNPFTKWIKFIVSLKTQHIISCNDLKNKQTKKKKRGTTCT